MTNCKKYIFFEPWEDIVKIRQPTQPIRLQKCLEFHQVTISKKISSYYYLLAKYEVCSVERSIALF